MLTILVVKVPKEKKQAQPKSAVKKPVEKKSEQKLAEAKATEKDELKTKVPAKAATKLAEQKTPLSKPVQAAEKPVEEELDYEKLEAFSDEEMRAAEQSAQEKRDDKLTRSELQRQIDFKNEAMIHIDALYNFALRMTGDPEDANDLVQETYLKAYRFFDSFEKGTNCKAWLFRILKNSYINRYRKESKEPDKVDYDEIKEFYHTVKHSSLDSNDMQEKIFGELLDDEVARALESLPEDFREVVQLCDIEGFTYEEIANMVDCPIGTVRSRLHRGRKILREKLLEYARYHGYKVNPDEWNEEKSSEDSEL
ncbi:MAG: sigma-70 family RNA polymerase sigma factor [Chloroherpetonaceae bacterium]|nr:sigma-70 family RNA polymerase sigma factor [Chloroherpetonaceae bacterium]